MSSNEMTPNNSMKQKCIEIGGEKILRKIPREKIIYQKIRCEKKNIAKTDKFR